MAAYTMITKKERKKKERKKKKKKRNKEKPETLSFIFLERERH